MTDEFQRYKRMFPSASDEQIQGLVETNAHNNRVMAGKKSGTWYPADDAPLGIEVIATDREAVQASVQKHLGDWESSGRQSHLWSSPTHWMPLPEPPASCD